MKRSSWELWFTLLLGWIVATGLAAGEKPRVSRQAAHREADQLRRDWLRRQLPKLISNPAELSGIVGQLDTMSADEINALANVCLEELELRRQQQFAALREANARQRTFRAELERALVSRRAYAEPGPVGFFPVVTWLPEGVSLSAQAVVTPDGRHVRMSLMPFFSTIGPVYTFNYMTGETRRLPEFDPPSEQSPATTPVFDGLRTRNEPRPR